MIRAIVFDCFGVLTVSGALNDRLFDLITTELKPHYKIGLLSNSGYDVLDRLFAKSYIDLFDAMAFSYETGFVKPDSKAYEIITQRLGVAPQEALLIDDQQAHCNGAREAGLSAIRYTDVDHLHRALISLFSGGR